MAKVKVTLDKRSDHMTKDGKYPLVLRLSHKSKTRDIGFDIHLKEDQFNEATCTLSGIKNAVRNSKRVQKSYADIDLWIDENKGEIKLWPISQLKDKIEKKFFSKQSELNLLEHGAKMLYRYHVEERYSTASSYEDALKVIVKYNMRLAKKDDKVQIRTLFNRNAKDAFSIKDEYRAFDMPIKAFNVVFAKDFKTYLDSRIKSKNSVAIYLRSLQAILNDAERTYDDLKGHKPLEGFKKKSTANAPVVLTTEEIEAFREASYPRKDSRFHARNYFLFMFNNMGMNFYDIAIAKVHQFDGERFSYTRKKTESEGDFFSIKQNKENLDIINYYSKDKPQDNYIFPIIPEDRTGEEIYRTKNGRLKWFNDNLKKIATDLGIEKKVSSYTARDTWTNIGLKMGIDLRKISAGLGHSTIEITEKNYAQSIQEKILDEINAQITGTPKPQ